MSKPTSDSPVGGRHGRWIGLFLILNYLLICAVKIDKGAPAEVWWMSHVGLLLAGLGLVLNRALLVAAALISILVLHALWLVDCICWWTIGTFPLAITNYLAHANAKDWIATSDHFYFAPLLIVVLAKHRSFSVEAAPP